MAKPTHRNQMRAIDNLNQYLQWHNLPVRMGRRGVCNGLASVHAQHVVQGKEDDFFNMLDKVASLNKDTLLDSEVNHFVTNIVLAHSPQLFDKESNQLRGVKSLSVEGRHLNPDFDFGMVTNEKNWSEIIKTLDLQDNEAMIVRDPGHAVSVSKKEGKYTLYDPNYDSGFKTFANEKALVKELQKNVFNYGYISPASSSEPLGMCLQVIRDPNASRNRDFPERSALYKKYLTKNNINQSAPDERGKNTNAMSYAIDSNDNNAVNQLFEQGFKSEDPFFLVNQAISRNKLAVLSNLLGRVPENKQREMKGLFKIALGFGRKEAFDMLKEHDATKPYFQELFTEDDSKYLIPMTAYGGSADLLEDVINHYKQMGVSDEVINEKINAPSGTLMGKSTDSIVGAINGGNVECAKLLVEQLDKTNALTQEKALDYLTAATIFNKPHLVNFFADTIESHFPDTKDKLFASIKMTTTAVEQTDLSILRCLKDAGVSFSKESEGVIAKKEARPVGYLLSMGIMLHQFKDFVREKIFGYEGVTYNAKKIEQVDEPTREPQAQASTLSDAIMNSKLPTPKPPLVSSGEEDAKKDTTPTPFSHEPKIKPED